MTRRGGRAEEVGMGMGIGERESRRGGEGRHGEEYGECGEDEGWGGDREEGREKEGRKKGGGISSGGGSGAQRGHVGRRRMILCESARKGAVDERLQANVRVRGVSSRRWRTQGCLA